MKFNQHELHLMQEALLCLKPPTSPHELEHAESICTSLGLQYGEMRIILHEHLMEIPR